MFDNQIIESPVEGFQKRYFAHVKSIGGGAEGEVFEAKVENQSFYQTNVAIKYYRKFQEKEEKFIDWILECQKKNQGEQISFLVKIFERIMYHNTTYLIMELGQCSLKQYLYENTLSQTEKMDICFQISKSLQFLHNHNYLHRDIKPENFVKFQNQFKLTDFGSIKQYDAAQETLDSIIGTLSYQAPEMQKQKYSQQIDIWSLGCTFYEIFQNKQFFTGQYLFYKSQGKNLKETEKQQKQYVENREEYLRKLNFYNMEIPIAWKNLIKKMLDEKPENRPIINQVVDEIQNIKNQPFIQINQQNIYEENKFYKIEANQEKYTLVVYGNDTKNEEVIDWLISKQHDNKIDPPLHTIIYGKYITNNKMYLIMESVSIQLQQYLHENSNLSQKEKLSIILDILKSIQYLHQNDYCHTDIQLDQYFKINNKWKLAQFQSLSKYQPQQQKQNTFDNQDAKSVDIFRLGCLFYEILEGKMLFGSRTIMVNKKEQIKYDLSNYLNKGIQNVSKQKEFEQLILPMLQFIDKPSINLDKLFEFIQDQLSILEAPTEQFPKRYFVLSKLLGDRGEGAVFQAKPMNK